MQNTILNDSSSNDLNKLVKEIVKHWYVFALVIFLALLITFSINRYSTAIYKVNAKVLINSDDPLGRRRQGSQAVTGLFEGLSLFSGNLNFQNELQNLRSTPLVKKAVEELNTSVSYYAYEGLKKRELYKTSPIVVVFDKNHGQPINTEFKIRFIGDSIFEFKAYSKEAIIYNFNDEKPIFNKKNFELKGKYKINESMTDEYQSFRILISNDFQMEDVLNHKFSFSFKSVDDQVVSYREEYKVMPANELSTIADINMEVQNVNKGIDFLNALIRQYLMDNLRQKNYIAVNTIEYIDGQLERISDSLSLAERSLQEFRSRNQVIDITTSAGRAYDQLRELEREQATLEIQNKYYEYINNYLEENKEIADLVAPSSMGIVDPLLNSLIQELSTLNAERNNLINNNQEKSPYMRNLNVKIENLGKTIRENIKYVLNTSKLSLENISTRINRLNTEIKSLPGTERRLVGIQRKYNLNDAIYTYLLQRRAEAEIAQASNLPDSKIIEPPKMFGRYPIYPKKKINYIVAFLCGIFLPFLFILLKDKLKNTISELSDVEKNSPYPILGYVNHNDTGRIKVCKEVPLSGIAESFRSVRTNLSYLGSETILKTLLISSSISKEGKSFIALNLAISLASNEKKVVLINFDIRRPMIDEYINISSSVGVTSFLIKKTNLEEIIVKSDIVNVDYIPAGPMPPNPAELISLDRVGELITQLSNMYDYIIIDTPPIGVISDSYLLMKYCDIKIFIARLNYTPLSIFKQVIWDLKNKDIKNLAVLINDFKNEQLSKKYYNKYYQNKKDSSIEKILKPHKRDSKNSKKEIFPDIS